MKERINCRPAFCSECILSHICLPSGLQKNERVRFEKLKKKAVILPPKKILYFQDDPFENLYILQSGSAKSYSLSNNGEEHITGFYFPSDFLGLEAIYSGRYTSYAVTLQTSSICIVSLKDLLHLSTEIPNLLEKILKLLSQRLAAYITMRSYHHAEEKVAVFLTQLSEHFKKLGYMPNECNLTMSRQDIGNYLGLATETVSRIFSHLQKVGMLEVQRRHILLDKEKICDFYHIDGS